MGRAEEPGQRGVLRGSVGCLLPMPAPTERHGEGWGEGRGVPRRPEEWFGQSKLWTSILQYPYSPQVPAT